MIQTKILECFDDLYAYCPPLYDYWCRQLYDAEGEMITRRWNEHVLDLMIDDVIFAKTDSNVSITTMERSY